MAPPPPLGRINGEWASYIEAAPPPIAAPIRISFLPFYWRPHSPFMGPSLVSDQMITKGHARG